MALKSKIDEVVENWLYSPAYHRAIGEKRPRHEVRGPLFLDPQASILAPFLLSIASRITRIWPGCVPQQPPMIAGLSSSILAM